MIEYKLKQYFRFWVTNFLAWTKLRRLRVFGHFYTQGHLKSERQSTYTVDDEEIAKTPHSKSRRKLKKEKNNCRRRLFHHRLANRYQWHARPRLNKRIKLYSSRFSPSDISDIFSGFCDLLAGRPQSYTSSFSTRRLSLLYVCWIIHQLWIINRTLIRRRQRLTWPNSSDKTNQRWEKLCKETGE